MGCAVRRVEVKPAEPPANQVEPKPAKVVDEDEPAKVVEVMDE